MKIKNQVIKTNGIATKVTIPYKDHYFSFCYVKDEKGEIKKIALQKHNKEDGEQDLLEDVWTLKELKKTKKKEVKMPGKHGKKKKKKKK